MLTKLIGSAALVPGGDSGFDLDTKGQLHSYTSTQFALDVGADDFVIYADSSTASGLAYGASPKSLFTAAGDILYASGANVLAKLSKGDNDQILTLKSGLPSWEDSGGGGGKFVYGRGLAAFGDAGYVYYPFFSGSLQYGGTESQHTQTLYFAYTIERNNCTVIANAMSVTTYIYVRDDGSDVAGITIAGGGTGQFDSGAISVTIASGSACCYARNGNSDSASITVNGIITTCST